MGTVKIEYNNHQLAQKTSGKSTILSEITTSIPFTLFFPQKPMFRINVLNRDSGRDILTKDHCLSLFLQSTYEITTEYKITLPIKTHRQ